MFFSYIQDIKAIVHQLNIIASKHIITGSLLFDEKGTTLPIQFVLFANAGSKSLEHFRSLMMRAGKWHRFIGLELTEMKSNNYQREGSMKGKQIVMTENTKILRGADLDEPYTVPMRFTEGIIII